MVICLELGADLHMAQRIPLSLASVKSRLLLPFWYRPTRVVLEKGPLNGCVCVCCCCVPADLFAYGPADATAIPKPHHILPSPDSFHFSGTGLPRLSWN